LAHNPLALSNPVPCLSSFLPVLLTSIRTNIALDETLAVLFDQFSRATELPVEVVSPLAEVLPSLASIHPDPSTRFLAYRLLAMLLKLAPPSIHFDILKDLASESEFPQMRTAAIGLVKEAVLESISRASLASTSNPFVSPRFMKTFSPILFRPSPPDLFSSNPSLAEFQDSSEPPRLAESIGLLYVLLRRDAENLVRVIFDITIAPYLFTHQTGIHDEFETVNSRLLKPIRSFLSSIQSIRGCGSEHGELSSMYFPSASNSHHISPLR
jgi:hypothetical protein